MQKDTLFGLTIPNNNWLADNPFLRSRRLPSSRSLSLRVTCISRPDKEAKFQGQLCPTRTKWPTSQRLLHSKNGQTTVAINNPKSTERWPSYPNWAGKNINQPFISLNRVKVFFLKLSLHHTEAWLAQIQRQSQRSSRKKINFYSIKGLWRKIKKKC